MGEGKTSEHKHERLLADVGKRGIGRQIVLPTSKAVEISLKNLRVRFWRALITAGGIILAIAFLTTVWTSSAIVTSLRSANDPVIDIMLRQKGYEVGGMGVDETEVGSSDTWLVGLSLFVASVGIINAMLMSVTERFREIGTMKCLGALDSFILKLFIIESSMQGAVGAFAGVILGFLLSLVMNSVSFGVVVFEHFPTGAILRYGLLALVIGTGLSLLGAVYPALVAARMEPVVAMRQEV